MRAAVIHRFGGPEEFEIVDDAARPSAGPGQVVVQVHAAGTNPLDYKIRDGSSGMCAGIGQDDFPLILGRECAGVVAEVGAGVQGFAVGDRVFGMSASPLGGGCYAEYVVMDEAWLAHSPDGIDDTTLAGLALVGLTAWMAVHDLGKVTSEDVVLVHGGGGGVGFTALQLAVATGAEVYATASARHAERIAAAGAAHIDYETDDFTQVTPRPTVIVDCVYFGTYEPSMDHLADGGRLVILPSLADLAPARERGIDVSIPKISPDSERLDALAARVADGSLTFPVARTAPLSDVAEVHRTLESGHAPGKIVLQVPGE